ARASAHRTCGHAAAMDALTPRTARRYSAAGGRGGLPFGCSSPPSSASAAAPWAATHPREPPAGSSVEPSEAARTLGRRCLPRGPSELESAPDLQAPLGRPLRRDVHGPPVAH